MTKRPLDITIVGVLFTCVGIGSLGHGAVRFARDGGVLDVALVAASALVASSSGVFMLRGRGWARWLCAGWLAFHVGLSLAHSGARLAVHGALFVAISSFLFRPAAGAYFRQRGTHA